ncbi:WD40/YVTN/BNR-like repeat-containing protein [Chitinophaga alhagiae]|uniref:WD40/YVTN/BNR-like repeat-containing protein n=1 Tax=Chitinophaga alhagiae TaxID=2203219 RepID=UPI0018E53048|nr:oxidoreductase [Chitinophaga alhagiae]
MKPAVVFLWLLAVAGTPAFGQTGGDGTVTLTGVAGTPTPGRLEATSVAPPSRATVQPTPPLPEAPSTPAPWRLRPLEPAPVSSIRGLSVVSDAVVWVSGTGGKAGRSLNGGKNWQWFNIPGCDSCDFRDIEAFSVDKAIVMAIAEPARIYLTTNGGQSWQQVYYNDTKGMFLDGMDFQNEKEGMAVGDAIGGRFTIIRTIDGGQSWQPLPGPEAAEGEAVFAASGTSIRALPGGGYAFSSGGARSRFFRYRGEKWTVTPTPVLQGGNSTGIFSFAFSNDLHGVAVGGDYLQPQQTRLNCVITNTGGATWNIAAQGPGGYRSAVEFISARDVVATGPSGTDFSGNGGLTWVEISGEGYHAVKKAKKGNTVYLAGSKGKMAVLESSHGDKGTSGSR